MTESSTFFKLRETEVFLYSKKTTKPYDSLFRNTGENRDNTWVVVVVVWVLRRSYHFRSLASLSTLSVKRPANFAQRL